MLRKTLYVAIIIILLGACRAEDYYYRDYLDNAEKYYPGTIDSLVLYPGNGRLQVHMRLSTDPKIKKIQLIVSNDLNSLRDTVMRNVDSSEIGKNVDVLLKNLQETRYTVTARGFSLAGDSSKAKTAIVATEGARYGGTIQSLNRVFSYFTTSPKGNKQAVFLVETVGSGFSPLQGTRIYFTRNNNKLDSLFLNPQDFAIDFPIDLKAKGSISFVSLYRKTVNSLDSFKTDEKVVTY